MATVAVNGNDSKHPATENVPRKKLSKNQWRRQKSKQKKHQQQEVASESKPTPSGQQYDSTETTENDTSVHPREEDRSLPQGTKLFESDLDIVLKDPQFAQYKAILDKFHTDEPTESAQTNGGDIFYSDDEGSANGSDDENSGNSGAADSLGKKKQKQLSKLPLAELKALAPKPEVVEWFDADAPDPLLLVEIKSRNGVVPVPEHWQFKREYLSSKRGIKKAPFDLPNYIKDTGIMEMRNNTKDDEQTLRQKARERVQPKMGKLDIDYAKLYNAFFRFQDKPRLYRFGEVYYEGKETELKLDHFRPGKLSQRLTEALNIPANAPPPWLLNMQRYGPPPSYAGLKIPGLNAPIPPGAQWGYQPGGYGRPPLDENGKPLYGDVYGITQPAERITLGNPVERTPWGKFFQDEPDEEYESEEEEEEEGEEADNENIEYDSEGAGYVDEETAVKRENYEDVPEIELRKTGKKEPEPFAKPKQLFQVLKEKTSSSSGFMGHQKSYDFESKSKVSWLVYLS